MTKGKRKILIVSFRYFGDALLCASLAERIKEVQASVEVSFLCYSRIAPIFKNIKAIDSIITVDERAPLLRQLGDIYTFIGTFDLAVITQLSTRAVVFGRLLGRKTVGFDPGTTKRNWWKKYFFSYIASDNKNDQPQILKFNELLDVVSIGRPEFLRVPVPSEILPSFVKIKTPYVVIHPTPQKKDRRLPTEKWRELIKYFSARGYEIVMTGSGLSSEVSYIDEIISASKEKAVNLAGKLSWGQTANLIREAVIYIGVDTGTTHLAAATGVPTYAIFGPTSIVAWGPWGINQNEPYLPFKGVCIQKRSNVTVVGLRPFEYCSNGCQEECFSKGSFTNCLSMLDTKMLIELIERDIAEN